MLYLDSQEALSTQTLNQHVQAPLIYKEKGKVEKIFACVGDYKKGMYVTMVEHRTQMGPQCIATRNKDIGFGVVN